MWNKKSGGKAVIRDKIKSLYESAILALAKPIWTRRRNEAIAEMMSRDSSGQIDVSAGFDLDIIGYDRFGLLRNCQCAECRAQRGMD